VPAGNYNLQAVATTASGLTAATETLPIAALDYTQTPSYSNAIAVNFVSSAVTLMAPNEMAGVAPQANWNQAGIANSGALTGLVDQNGQATTALVGWSAPNTFSTGIADQAGNNRMMKGYLDDNNTAANSVSVSGLPAAFKLYDVIVYFDGANGSATRASNYRFTSIGKTSQVQGCSAQTDEGSVVTGTDAAGVDFGGTFVQASGGSAGNYVKFLNCTGSGFSLDPVHAGSTDNQVRAPINGMQILAHQ
jgi:hypothetical protein